MTSKIIAVLKNYHRYLARLAEDENIVSRQLYIGIQAAPWALIPISGMLFVALLGAKFHFSSSQRGLAVLPFFVVGGLGMIYVICVIGFYGVRQDLRQAKSRRSRSS